jgi:hypothetical protein
MIRLAIPAVVISLVVWLFAITSTLAGIIAVPTDLGVGDQYRLAFVTSTTTDATSTNIDDYNT